MLRDRFLLVQQRLQRNEMFCKPLIASTNRDYIEVGTAGGIDGVPASESRCLLIVPRRSGNKRPPLSLSLCPCLSSRIRLPPQLSTIDTLIGSKGGVKWLLGTLCEVEEGSFYLEDLNAHVPLDLSQAVSPRCRTLEHPRALPCHPPVRCDEAQ